MEASYNARMKMFLKLFVIFWAIPAIYCDWNCNGCECSHDRRQRYGVLVDCRGRRLTSVPNKFTRRPWYTTYLDLSGNQIKSLNTHDFDYMTELRTIFLSNNKISSLPPGVFDKLKWLKILTLDRNQLTSLPPNLFHYKFKFLSLLYLYDNPLICSCELYHTMVDVVPRLDYKTKYVGTCDGDVELRTMTRDNKEKFCGEITTTRAPTTTTTPRTTTQKVDGGWSSWSTYTPCSVTCGIGERSRCRKCNNPTPKGGGKICKGGMREDEEIICIKPDCP